MTQPTGSGVRARRREHLESEILRLGRRQLAEVGAAGVSLRQVARELGMASSAVYRYVASRDELLTRLIVESYDALGDAVEEAESKAPRNDHVARWTAVGHAMRDWALAHPYDWALLYGSPVPGYQAPAERTNAAGTRVPVLLGRLVDDAARHRAVAPDSRRPVAAPGATAYGLEVAAELNGDDGRITPDLMLAGVTAWTLVVGAVSSEVFAHLGPDVGDPLALFDYALAAAGRLVLR